MWRNMALANAQSTADERPIPVICPTSLDVCNATNSGRSWAV